MIEHSAQQAMVLMEFLVAAVVAGLCHHRTQRLMFSVAVGFAAGLSVGVAGFCMLS